MSEFLSDIEVRPFVAPHSDSSVATSLAPVQTVGKNIYDDLEWEEVPREIAQPGRLDEFLRASIGSADLLVCASDWESLGAAHPFVGMTVETQSVLPIAEIFDLSEKTWYVLDVRGAHTRGQLGLSWPRVSERFFVRPRRDNEVIALNEEPSSCVSVFWSGRFARGDETAGSDGGVADKPSRTARAETRSAIRKLLRSAEHEDFEPGMVSAFERELGLLVLSGGDGMIAHLRELLFSEPRGNQRVAETLGALSRLEDPRTHRSRLSLLHHCLTSTSIVVRDAAVLGLEELDDADSVPFLRSARAIETCLQLREDMDAVLAVLSK